MAKEKKRLTKKAKVALKLLKDSKLLATAKTTNDSKTEQNFKPSDVPVNTTAPNKIRPEKKRG
ncbi:hypothetical protein BH24ACI2_BH24ACI2_06740 [soil metagenome]|jgi:hypothetical protein|nr:hypothetical protein [Acidobacteriota bacterium]